MLINARTGKKTEKLESGLLMSMVPPRAGTLPQEWALNWTGGLGLAALACVLPAVIQCTREELGRKAAS